MIAWPGEPEHKRSGNTYFIMYNEIYQLLKNLTEIQMVETKLKNQSRIRENLRINRKNKPQMSKNP